MYIYNISFYFYCIQVLESELIGNKIVLTDKKLKLGKKKYKVECKSIDNTSWVFASGKVHKPYKIGIYLIHYIFSYYYI